MVPELTYRARASQDGPTATETEVTDGVVCRAPPSLALKPVERNLPGSREGLYVARGNNIGTAAYGIWFFSGRSGQIIETTQGLSAYRVRRVRAITKQGAV